MRSLIFQLAAVALLSGALGAQTEQPEAAVGYLRIFTDVDLVQIYLNGEPIGASPIREKITVNPGWHTISFFSPDFKWTHWTHRQRKVIAGIIESGTYHVLVKPGEDKEVSLEWHALERDLIRYESGRGISAAAGMFMVAMTLLLLARAS